MDSLKEDRLGEDRAQRDAAIDPLRSFIVQAPAGSGKTELLMQRYLNLLSTVERPEEILALTFTRKAAGEMQDRIIKAFEKIKKGETGKSPHEQKTLELAKKALEREEKMMWGILDNPGRLKVQTIDSFCSHLVRQMPLLSGMGGHPAIADDPQELYREAAKRTLEMVEDESDDGESVRGALRHLDNSAKVLTDSLVDMLSKRDQWLRHLEVDNLRSDLERSLANLVASMLSGLNEAFPKDLIKRFLEGCGYAAENIEQSEKNGPITSLAGITSLPGDRAEDLTAWKGIRDMLLTKDNTLRKTVNVGNGFPPNGPEAKWKKDDFIGLLKLMEGDDRFIPMLARVRDLPEPFFSDAQWEALRSIIDILPLADRHLAEVMADLNRSDFQSIAMAAIASLGTDDAPTDLMLSLDMRYRHILVDEYQDTSRSQLELLKGLTRGWSQGDGRTLFLVGDPMQSIYLFREADVGLFIEARDEGIKREPGLPSLKLVPLTLEANFRSQENIIKWVNDTFSGAFSAKEDKCSGAVRYAPSEATKSRIDDIHPQVRVFAQRDDRAEAAAVVSLIKAVPAGESVAVLCRSRGHLASIVPELKKEGIPFRAIEIDGLEKRPVVQDLLAITRALCHPLDRVAWLAMLRAPWCGLALSDILALVSAGRERPVLSLIKDDEAVAMLSPEGSKRLLRVRDAISRAAEGKGRACFRGLAEGLWIELGGPACAATQEATDDARAFFDLLDEVASPGREDIVPRLEARLKGLYATHSGVASIKLDLMTIHKAKGLEFDHVILPGLGKTTRNNKKKLMLWMERADDLLLAPIGKKSEKDPIYDLLKKVDSEKDGFETVRAFYVACTRAKKTLHLFGHMKTAVDGSLRLSQSSLLRTIEGALRPEMIEGEAGASAVTGDDNDNGVDEASTVPLSEPLDLKLKRLHPDWVPCAPAGAICGLEAQEEVHQDKGPEFYWAGHVVKHLGTVVHRYMCAIAGEGLSKWSAIRLDGERKNMEGILRRLGLNRDEATDASARAVAILKTSLEDEKGRWVLGPHDEAFVELPLTALIDDVVVRSILDRTFVSDGVRWIVDYKTSLHEGGAVDEFLDNEKKRYLAQLERYEKALRLGGEKREIKKGLYYPALGQWIEW